MGRYGPSLLALLALFALLAALRRRSVLSDNGSGVGFKKNVNRATTQVMMKTGHVEKTNDRDYEVEERWAFLLSPGLGG